MKKKWDKDTMDKKECLKCNTTDPEIVKVNKIVKLLMAEELLEAGLSPQTVNRILNMQN